LQGVAAHAASAALKAWVAMLMPLAGKTGPRPEVLGAGRWTAWLRMQAAKAISAWRRFALGALGAWGCAVVVAVGEWWWAAVWRHGFEGLSWRLPFGALLGCAAWSCRHDCSDARRGFTAADSVGCEGVDEVPPQPVRQTAVSVPMQVAMPTHRRPRAGGLISCGSRGGR
jgi:hypothetical protein